MKNWRIIFSWREELPNGFGKDVIAKSEAHPGSSYVGVCIYQNENSTYAVWSDKPTEDSDLLDNDLMDMQEIFEENKEHYLEEVRRILTIPEKTSQHLILADIKPHVTWLWTWKCKFLGE